MTAPSKSTIADQTEIPLIVMTALQNPIVPAGVTMLGKPIDTDALIAAVGNKCRRKLAATG